MKPGILLFVALASLGGCVTTQLTPEAQAVRVTSNADAAKGCKLVGPVDGGDHWNGGIMGQGAAEENAQRRLRNNAAKMGANLVLFITQSTNTSGSTVRGEAYTCPQAQ